MAQSTSFATLAVVAAAVVAVVVAVVQVPATHSENVNGEGGPVIVETAQSSGTAMSPSPSPFSKAKKVQVRQHHQPRSKKAPQKAAGVRHVDKKLAKVATKPHKKGNVKKQTPKLSSKGGISMDDKIKPVSSKTLSNSTSHWASEGVNAVIRATSYNAAVVFINGVPVASLVDAATVTTTSRSLKRGDVIAVMARGSADGAHGIAVSIHLADGRVYATGRDDFRAVAAHGGRSWTQKGYSMCTWPRAMSIYGQYGGGAAGILKEGCGGQERSGVTYVWGKKCVAKGAVFLRFVVGGITCRDRWKQNGKRQGRRAPKTGGQDPLKQQPGGSGSGGSGESRKRNEARRERCRCRQATGPRGGTCYFFTGRLGRHTRRWRRVCESRKCQREFECVENGNRHTHRCMWKVTRKHIRPIGTKHAGRVFCKHVALEKKRLFLVPYSQV